MSANPGTAPWYQALFGIGPAATAIDEQPDPNAMTSDAIDDILDEVRTDIARMNLVTLGVDISPEQIKAWRNRARFNDPRYLYAFYDEMIRLGPGPQMDMATEAMKSARVEYVTTPEAWDDDDGLNEGDDPQDVAQARAARDFIEDTFEDHIETLIENHASQEFYGLADSKIVLDPRGNSGRWDSITAIEAIPQRRHRLDTVTHQWMLMPSPDSWEGVPVPELILRPDGGTQGLFFTELGTGTRHLDQRGLLFRCLVPWNLLQYLVRWRAKYAELFGIPPRYAVVDFSLPNRVQEAKVALKNMGSTSYGVFNTGTELKLLSAGSMGATDPFAEQIDWCYRQFDNAILGHSQATGVQKGVGGKMQGDQAIHSFEELTNSRLRRLSQQISNKLARTLVARNFGNELAASHTPKVRLRFIQKDDPTELARVALTLKQAGAGEEVGSEDVVKRCGLRVAMPGDKNLGAAAGAAGAPGAPGEPATGNIGLAAEVQEMARDQIAAMKENMNSPSYLAVQKIIRDYQQHELKRATAFVKKKAKTKK